MKNRFAAVTRRREEVVAEKNDAMGRYGATPQVSTQQAVQAIEAGNPKPDSKPADTAAPKPAATAGPAGTPPAGPQKIATLENVKAYAQKKGITVDAAKQEFAAAKYQVQ
jgi:hypothetical protein